MCQELKVLRGGRIDKIYNPEKSEIVILVHVPSKGKHILRIISGRALFVSEFKESYDQPSGFCMYLRKHLSNTKLTSIAQVGSERIIKIDFEKYDTSCTLYLELFGKGNITLTQNNQILNALIQKKWSDRTIKKGNEYSYPKRDFDFSISKEVFIKLLSQDKDLVLILAKDLGLGGSFAEEICNRAGIEKKKKILLEKEKTLIYSLFKDLLKQKISAYVIYKDSKISTITPFKYEIFKDFENKTFPTYGKALDFYFREEYSKKLEFQSKHQDLIDKTKKIVQEQSSNIKKSEKKAADNQKKAELIYENYKIIEEILAEIKKARKTLSFDEIKKRLKGHKTISELNQKEKTIKVKL